MPIETATYLASLNQNSPDSTDRFADTDDHLRLIKRVLQETLPGLTRAFDLPAIEAAVSPIGSVLMYAFDTAPTGWKLCDGSTYARSDGAGNITVPDLRDRFVAAAGLTYSLDDLIGNNTAVATTTTAADHIHFGTADSGGAHGHGAGVTGSTSLTQEALGAAGASTAVVSGPQSHAHTIAEASGHIHTLSVGAGGTHAHNVSVDVRPAAYVLTFICKI